MIKEYLLLCFNCTAPPAGEALRYDQSVSHWSVNASRCLLVLRLSGQLPAVLPGVPLPLLAQEVLQFAALLQLLVLLSQLQLLLLGCKTTKKSVTKIQLLQYLTLKSFYAQRKKFKISQFIDINQCIDIIFTSLNISSPSLPPLFGCSLCNI